MSNHIEGNIRLRAMIEMAKMNLNKHELMSAITWMILGDGSLTAPPRGHSRLEITHVDHTDYLEWKKSIIENITGAEIKDRPPSKSGYSDNWSQRLRSKTHPVFSILRERLYAPRDRKAIDVHALKILTPLGLAILYQDDGSYSCVDYKGRYGVDRNLLIHTMAYGELENEALARTIVKRSGLIFRVNRVKKSSGLKYRLRLRTSDIDKFFEMIEPYIVPSMMYKLGRGSEQISVAA